MELTGLTLMAVHAHPDDESTSTGGILAHYSRLGVRVVVVTCTNGELGDGPGGVKPGSPGHDPTEVAALRRQELAAACRTLGVADTELLDYHDSGMADWPQRQQYDVFCDVPVAAAAERLAAHIEHHRPQVVVTYDPFTSYQHPDHIHAANVATAAVAQVDSVRKLYYKAHGTAYWTRLRDVLARIGVHRPAPAAEVAAAMQVVQQRITTVVDTEHMAAVKRAGLHCHRSQLGSSVAAKLSPELFAEVFGVETYIRAVGRTGAELPESDLFAGL